MERWDRARDVRREMWGVTENKRNKREDEFKDAWTEMQPEIQTHRPKERHTAKKRTIERETREKVPRLATFQGHVWVYQGGRAGKIILEHSLSNLSAYQSHLEVWWPHLSQSC